MATTLRYFCVLTAILLVCDYGSNAVAQNKADQIIGIYDAVGVTTQEKCKVKFYQNGDTYEGRIIWLENPYDAQGNVRYDEMNPDPELRKIKGTDVVVVYGIRYDPEADEWSGGKIYDPVSGKTHDVVISFDSPTRLKIRGYIGKRMLGKNIYWNKTS